MIDITDHFKCAMDELERLKRENSELTQENSRINSVISELSREIAELREVLAYKRADLEIVRLCGFEFEDTPEGQRIMIGHHSVYVPDRSKLPRKS